MFSGSARARANESNKRRKPREERSAAARLLIDGVETTRACTIRDINEGGARVSLPSLNGIPPEVVIVCSSEGLLAQAAIAWKRDGEIGLRFVRRGKMHLEEEFRRRQQTSYATYLADVERAKNQPSNEFSAQHYAQALIQNYRIMDLDPTREYSECELKKQYRVMAIKVHPDQGGSAEEFQALNEAYTALVQHSLLLQSTQKMSA